MKRILFGFLILIFLFINNFILLPDIVQATAKVRAYTSLTGGGFGALDATSVDDLQEGDAARVSVISGTTVTRYDYIFDANGTDAESSPTIIRPDDFSTEGVWRLAKFNSNMINTNAGTNITNDLEEETHASEHNEGGADPIDRFTEGITEVETTNSDTTPDVTNGSSIIKRLLESNGNGTVTDFDDGTVCGDQVANHSCLITGDWFIFRITDASTIIDFSDNANIEGNNNTDFTGSATQIVDLLFMWDGSAWQCLNLYIGMSDPTTISIDSFTTTETEYIPIAYMDDTAANNPAAAAIVITTSNSRKYNARAFDGGTDENLTFNWMVPSDIDETSGIKFRIILIADNADPPTSGDDATIEFELSGISIGANDTGDFASFGSAQTSTWGDVTAGVEDILILSWSSAITVTDLADGEIVQFLLNRDADDGTNDQYDQDVNVIGIELKYKREHNATF